MSSAGSNATGSRREARRAAGHLHGRVLLAGDHVGVGDDLVGSRRPAGALDREPAGGPDHADHAVRGRAHAGLARDARRGRRHVRRGTGDRGKRVQPRERSEDRAGGRHHLVQFAQDRRLLDVGAEPALPRRLRRHGGDDPDDPERERDAEQRAERAVGEACARQHDHAAQPQSEALEAAREDRAREQRAHETEGGRVRRRRAFGQQQRAEPRSDEGAQGEAGE